MSASLTHKNSQRRKIIHGMHPIGCKECSIDFKIFWVEYPVVCVISMAVDKDAYLF